MVPGGTGCDSATSPGPLVQNRDPRRYKVQHGVLHSGFAPILASDSLRVRRLGFASHFAVCFGQLLDGIFDWPKPIVTKTDATSLFTESLGAKHFPG